MVSRGQPAGLIGGLFIALPAGGAGALALMAGGNGALVGVAIAVALLPPLTNTGMLFAMSIIYYFEPPMVLTDEEKRYFRMSLFSFLLFCLNFCCIFIMAYAMFKLKGIHAIKGYRSTKWREFSNQLSTSTSMRGPASPSSGSLRRKKRHSISGDQLGFLPDNSTTTIQRSLCPGTDPISKRGPSSDSNIQVSDNGDSEALLSPLLDAQQSDAMLGLNESTKSLRSQLNINGSQSFNEATPRSVTPQSNRSKTAVSPQNTHKKIMSKNTRHAEV